MYIVTCDNENFTWKYSLYSLDNIIGTSAVEDLLGHFKNVIIKTGRPCPGLHSIKELND